MYQDWLAMEAFFYYQLFYICLIGVVIAVLITAVLGYGFKRNRFAQIVYGLALVFLFLAGPYSYHQFSQYGDLRAAAQYANPAVRNYQQHMLSQVPFSEVEKGTYRNRKMTKAFEGVGLYQRQELSQPIKYLGSDDYRCYFVVEPEEVIAVSKFYVKYTDTNQAQMVGMQYQLGDSQFEELGFVAQSKKYFSHFEVPIAQVELRPIPHQIRDSKGLSDTVGYWIAK